MKENIPVCGLICLDYLLFFALTKLLVVASSMFRLSSLRASNHLPQRQCAPVSFAETKALISINYLSRILGVFLWFM